MSVGNDDNGCIIELHNVSSRTCTVIMNIKVQLVFSDMVIIIFNSNEILDSLEYLISLLKIVQYSIPSVPVNLRNTMIYCLLA